MADEKPTHLNVHYLKGADYKEVHCDGAIGGPTPQGLLYVGVYTERFVLPRTVDHDLVETASGDLEMQKDNFRVVDAREGLARSLQVGMYLNVETAERLHTWLGKHIEVMKAAAQ